MLSQNIIADAGYGSETNYRFIEDHFPNCNAFIPYSTMLKEESHKWKAEDQLSPRDRSLITIAALMTNGDYEQLKYHLQHGKDNGITKDEIIETVTQLAFYVGWPKAWTVLKMAKEIWK